MSGVQVWVDGRLLPAEAPAVGAFDRGLRSGEGVFETFRVIDGRVFGLDDHLARLRAGAGHLGFEVDERQVLAGLTAVVHANQTVLGGDLAARVTCTAGPVDPVSPFPGIPAATATVVVTVQRAPPPNRQATAVSVPLRREVAELKATSYLVPLLAQRRAGEAGASDALLTDPAGAPLEAATANLFAVCDGVLVTPPLSAGVLPGVTRAAVLRLAAALGLPAAEVPLPASSLRTASEALLTSAVRGLRPLVAVDGHAVGDGRPGPVTVRLQEAYATAIARQGRSLPVSPPGGG